MKVTLSERDLLTIEVGLRKLQTSGEVDQISLGFLMERIAGLTGRPLMKEARAKANLQL